MEKTFGKKLSKNHNIYLEHQMKGKQLILETTNPKAAKLLKRFVNIKYNGNFEKFIEEIIKKIGAEVISTEQIKLDNKKSIIAIIQESHAQLIITLSEKSHKIFFDIFTCGKADPFKIKDYILSKSYLKNIWQQIFNILRGEGLETIYEEDNANHLILDVKNCKNIDLLKDEEKLIKILLNIINDFIKPNITPTIDNHKFSIENPSEVNLSPEDGGVSVTIDLGDGIIAIHTYPEIGGFMLDIRKTDLDKETLLNIYKYLEKVFKFKNIYKKMLKKV